MKIKKWGEGRAKEEEGIKIPVMYPVLETC
jgi:hypothetical protein